MLGHKRRVRLFFSKSRRETYTFFKFLIDTLSLFVPTLPIIIFCLPLLLSLKLPKKCIFFCLSEDLNNNNNVFLGDLEHLQYWTKKLLETKSQVVIVQFLGHQRQTTHLLLFPTSKLRKKNWNTSNDVFFVFQTICSTWQKISQKSLRNF